MKRSKFDLSICIVNWNSSGQIKRCLESIYKNSGNFKLEIIVVDNASTDDSVRMIKSDFPEVLLIENKENIGFGRANNLAIRKSNGEYILILNPDIIVIQPVFHEMILFLASNKHVGVVGCKLVNDNGKVQKSFNKYFPNCFLSLINIFLPGKVIESLHIDPKKVNHSIQVAWIIGACMLFRREILLKLNGFDEQYYMFCEDIDVCYRLKLMGMRTYYLGNLEMLHDHGASIKKQAKSYFSAVLQRESVYRFMVTHRGMWFVAIPYRLIWILIAISRILIMSPIALFYLLNYKKMRVPFFIVYNKYLRIISWGLGLEKWTRQIIPK